MQRHNGCPLAKLDKDLKKIAALESALHHPGRVRALFLGFLFLVLLLPFTYLVASPSPGLFYVMAAGVIGGYMAMNIGANDVANNVGPAVGSKALTLTGALILAAICEAAGAIIAGAEVVGTVSRGIVHPDAMPTSETFVRAMLAALLGAALWLNLATAIGAPVSTTHSVVGGVLGVGVAAAGLGAVNWPVMGTIAASWVISPVMGGVVAAGFLFMIKQLVLREPDKLTAGKVWVPVVVGIMGGAFSAYLLSKGLSNLWKPPKVVLGFVALGGFVLVWLVMRQAIQSMIPTLENTRKGVARTFTVPLIVAAALLSFAHGANDVANAVGPLAAIVSTVQAAGLEGGRSGAIAVPGWVLVVGASGIALGLVLFGPRLIRTVGEKITKLDPIRAFCVALSAAITVLIASELGLPVSSTHIAVGGIFGVGFLREFHANRTRPPAAENATQPNPLKEEKRRKRRLVRRQYMMTIATAWVVTVPATAALAAALFLTLNWVM